MVVLSLESVGRTQGSVTQDGRKAPMFSLSSLGSFQFPLVCQDLGPPFIAPVPSSHQLQSPHALDRGVSPLIPIFSNPGPHLSGVSS